MSYERISVERAKEIIAEGKAAVVDIRDPQSYATAHIEDAIQLNDSNVGEFIASTPKATPVIIYCYHGNTSQGAADFFAAQGFEEVYSMDGGFEEWR